MFQLHMKPLKEFNSAPTHQRVLLLLHSTDLPCSDKKAAYLQLQQQTISMIFGPWIKVPINTSASSPSRGPTSLSPHRPHRVEGPCTSVVCGRLVQLATKTMSHWIFVFVKSCVCQVLYNQRLLWQHNKLYPTSSTSASGRPSVNQAETSLRTDMEVGP